MAKYKTKTQINQATPSLLQPRKSTASNKERPVHEYAEELVRQEGFTIPNRPGEEVPGLPNDITGMDDKRLMGLMREQLAWLEYSGYRLARGEIMERELDLRIERRRAWMLVSRWGGESSDRVAIAKAEAEQDKELESLRTQHLKAMAYRKIVQNLYDAAERRIALVSRELTRRTSMEPYQKRAHKHGGA